MSLVGNDESENVSVGSLSHKSATRRPKIVQQEYWFMTDYYKTLGVERNASPAEIQKAYRNLARKYHPDLNPNDKTAKQKFQAVQQAYEVLNDPKKREMYNRHGSASFEQPSGPSGQYTWRSYPGGAGFEDIDLSELFGGESGGGGFGDFFRQFTGRAPDRRARRKEEPSRGTDIEHRLEIPFRTAISGGEAQITVRRATGKLETITVKIPAGIESGKKIRLRGQGEPAPSGEPSGDILITIIVAAHPHYQRSGPDLIVRVPVTVGEAALGAKVDVPTPSGTISLRIPPNTSSGKRLRIKGHGVRTRDRTGDLLAEVQIVLPESMDSESLELVRRLDERTKFDPRSELAW
jgi:DnaJ-class molecular chaperone